MVLDYGALAGQAPFFYGSDGREAQRTPDSVPSLFRLMPIDTAKTMPTSKQ